MRYGYGTVDAGVPSSLWGWRTVIFQLSGSYCNHNKDGQGIYNISKLLVRTLHARSRSRDTMASCLAAKCDALREARQEIRTRSRTGAPDCPCVYLFLYLSFSLSTSICRSLSVSVLCLYLCLALSPPSCLTQARKR